MKYAALLIMFFLSSFTGIYKSMELRSRSAELSCLHKGFERLCLEISSFGDICDRALQRAADVSGSRVLAKICEYKDSPPLQKYQKMRADFKAGSFLKNTDWCILDDFFPAFGKTNREDQTALCKNTVEALRKQIAEAESDRKKYSGLWIEGGILTGILITILFI